MTIHAARFTPEVLLSAPRRSAGIPNQRGDLLLYTVSAYSFETHTKTSQIRIFSIENGASHMLIQDITANEPVWISNDEIIFVKSGDRGSAKLIIMNVREASSDACHELRHFSGAISNIKAKPLSDGRVAFCCSAVTTIQDELHSPAAKPPPRSSAKIYTSLFVRHWDTWVGETHNSLWYGELVMRDGKWTLANDDLHNLLAGTPLACPVEPFGGAGDFDISASGIAFVSKDTELNPARNTKTDLYYAPLTSFSHPPSKLQVVETPGLQGYTLSPVFSNDGKQLIFARMRNQQYETDKQRLLKVCDVEDLSHVEEFYVTKDGNGGWDMRPDLIMWSYDDKELYVAADEHGRTKLWRLPSSPSLAKDLPEAIYEVGSVVDARVLGRTRKLLISSRSRVENSSYSVLDLDRKGIKEISSSSKGGKSFGLKSSQCLDIWYAGSREYDNHALVMVPSDFDKTKQYPVAFLIHGGPQSAWSDDWSTRWNPAIFAEQGYIVICPNPTGSTGYGQEHTDAIAGNWGGAPYDDIVKCFEYVEKELDYADTDRAVALGGSYGGYMICWIQGHDLGRKFKALVCHDGVFSTQNQWCTEELFFPEHDFQGTLWENREGYVKWDPSLHTHEWATPMLVIHSELDYRLPVSEGLAMFNVLQARSVPSKLLVFPDENHWVLKPENSLVWHREVLGWINEYSGVAGKTTLESDLGNLSV